jgi:hypothetical protein
MRMEVTSLASMREKWGWRSPAWPLWERNEDGCHQLDLHETEMRKWMSPAWPPWERNEDGCHQLGLHEREMRMDVTSLTSMRQKWGWMSPAWSPWDRNEEMDVISLASMREKWGNGCPKIDLYEKKMRKWIPSPAWSCVRVMRKWLPVGPPNYTYI